MDNNYNQEKINVSEVSNYSRELNLDKKTRKLIVEMEKYVRSFHVSGDTYEEIRSKIIQEAESNPNFNIQYKGNVKEFCNALLEEVGIMPSFRDNFLLISNIYCVYGFLTALMAFIMIVQKIADGTEVQTVIIIQQTACAMVYLFAGYIGRRSRYCLYNSSVVKRIGFLLVAIEILVLFITIVGDGNEMREIISKIVHIICAGVCVFF